MSLASIRNKTDHAEKRLWIGLGFLGFRGNFGVCQDRMLAGDRESIDTASILIAAVAEHYLRASIRESCVYIYV